MRTPALLALLVLVSAALIPCAAFAQSIERDLSYGPDPAQKLDLTLPAAENFPTVIFLHGGSLTSGDKSDSDYARVCEPFPSAGIACANVNYRLAPQHTWPAQPEDVAAAISWVRAHISSRAGDPKKLFLLGHSSGAMLVAVVASDDRFLAKFQIKPVELRGVMPMGSIMWDDELEQTIAQYGRARTEQAWSRDSTSRFYSSFDAYHDLWPIHHVHAEMPAFLFLIAEAEQEHPPILKTNSKFVEDTRKLGNEAAFRVLPGRTHYSAIRQLHQPADSVFAIILDFIRSHT
jgi:acetyl esterase/lipase